MRRPRADRARGAGVVCVVALLLAPCTVFAGAQAGAPWLLVISGIGGDQEHREAFAELSVGLIDAAIEQWDLPAANVRYLAERDDVAPGRVEARSTAANVADAMRWLAEAAAPGDTVLVVLIGHGSAQGGEGRFNLPGPDMGPDDFAPLLEPLSDTRLAFVNTTSSSADFMRLAAPGRTIVTATRSSREQQETLFPRYWLDAFASGAADTDKDGRLSVLEAFVYATTEVGRFYESEGRLRTEHALLDDDGDGEGSADPLNADGDGELARWVAFGGPVAVGPAGAEDPELAGWLAERERLQAELAELRGRRDTLDEDRYLDLLEELLVDIAELDRRIRERTGGGT